MRIIRRIAKLTLKLNYRLVMPFTRIEVPNDVLAGYGQAIGNAVQQAMIECFNVDPSDLFT